MIQVVIGLVAAFWRPLTLVGACLLLGVPTNVILALLLLGLLVFSKERS